MKIQRQSVVRTSLAAGLACAILAGPASADDLINNLAEPLGATTICGTVDPDLIWSSQSFFTPSPAILNSITTVLGLSTDAPDIVCELRAGADPSGPVLASFVLPELDTADVGFVTLTPDTTVVLQPGETYWLVLYAATTGSFGWSYAYGNAYVGPGALGSYDYSYDYGATWIDTGTDNPYFMGVDVTFTVSCPADFNGDGFLTGDDYDAYVNEFYLGNDTADFNADGFVTGDDFDAYVDAFIAGC